LADRLAAHHAGDALFDANRAFYDRLWTDARLIGPERFNTWTLVQSLAASGARRLEVGPGLRPRLPVLGTVFADISLPALRALGRAGGVTAAASLSGLPFADAAFGLISAMDIVEHVADDGATIAELSRVAAPGAVLLLSVPLHASAWSTFDEVVGHHRRYEPDVLVGLLASVGFVVERSAPSGMLPRSNRLQRLGMWFLARQRERAMWWYNRVFMPLGLRRAPVLELTPGMVPTNEVGGVLLVCRKVID
jgi:SAM-dependent methyltransferase